MKFSSQCKDLTNLNKKERAKMKNTLGDLNNHLFAQLERLGDEDLEGEELQEEINRAKAVSVIAGQIISNGNLVLEAEKFKADTLGRSNAKSPQMLEG
jgi:hypothetical protein